MTDDNVRDRTHLPIPDAERTGLITFDAKDPDTRYPPSRDIRPPKGAPNVLVILLDDVGFGASSAFGGPCQTSNAERLAATGLKYTRLHTTALCSPTRPPAPRPRPNIPPLPPGRAFAADGRRDAVGPQSSRRRYGWHHRDRHVGARLQ